MRGVTIDWLNDIPATVNEDGYLQLTPENSEAKSVIEVAPAFKEAVDYMIANDFPGVLS